ncbi:MAG: TetR/AcrR family transcriptional regulator [Myxococcota bacterium]
MVARANKQRKRTRLKPDVRRAQLLDVGLEVFAKDGLDATNLDDVAAAAGVTKPVVYHYFKNKQDFFDAIAEREMRRAVKLVEEASDGAVTYEAAVELTCHALFHYLDERPHGFRALMSHAPIAWQGDDRLSEMRSAFYAAVVTSIEVAIERSCGQSADGALVAHAVVGAFIFAAQHWLGDSSATPKEVAAGQLAKLLNRGLKAIIYPSGNGDTA